MAKFQKGHAKIPGSGRKPGQGNKQPARRFYTLLDGDEFKLKKILQEACLTKDYELIKSIAALLKAVGAENEAPGTTDTLQDLANLSDEEIQKLVPPTPIHSQS